MINIGGLTAAVLAGGQNSRFGGRDKAFVRIADVPMIELITGSLEKVFNRIIIVTNSPEKYDGWTGIALATDIYKNSGPLGGIHAAMMQSPTPYLFVFSCDMPYLDTGIIRDMVEFAGNFHGADAIIPRMNSRIEPLHAIYSKALVRDLGIFLDSTRNYSIRAFLKDKKVEYYDLAGTPLEIKSFFNVNRPSDIGHNPIP